MKMNCKRRITLADDEVSELLRYEHGEGKVTYRVIFHDDDDLAVECSPEVLLSYPRFQAKALSDLGCLFRDELAEHPGVKGKRNWQTTVEEWLRLLKSVHVWNEEHGWFEEVKQEEENDA